MNTELSASAKSIVDEEEQLLTKVENRLSGGSNDKFVRRDYEKELLELRDAINEARIEDKPQLLEQYDRLEALSKQSGKGLDVPIDPQNPYFGHLCLEENGRKQEILIGKHTFLDPDSRIRIVDWRNAPVSKIYYCYQEGDDYEEEINGQIKEGVVAKRRALGIENATLRRVSCRAGTFVKKDDGWRALREESFSLSGGQGSAIRPKGTAQLGMGADGRPRANNFLPEISALIDKAQFGLITNENPGILVVKGSAGSGKTTVALHRVAYLIFSDRHRYTPDKVLLIVANQSLASYTSQVLPSLGVHHIKAITYQEWASVCRQRIVRDLTDRYNNDTPPLVSRFKRHPMIIKAIVDQANARMAKLEAELKASLERVPDGGIILKGWAALSKLAYEQRRQALILWLKGQHTHPKLPVISHMNQRTATIAINILEHCPYGQARLIRDWAEIITDGQLLTRLARENAPGEFSAGDMELISKWNKDLYARFVEEPVAADEDDDEESDESGAILGADEDELPALDPEDDTIMLALFQHNVGRLPRPGGRLEYNHLMIDEVQDFSPFEVRVLLRTTAKEATITLAGDDAQAIVAESSFKSWESFLSQLGSHEVMTSQLQIAYRSTAEIMEVAMAVLGVKNNNAATKVTRHGAPVELHQFAESGEAVDFLAGALRELMQREPLASVAIIARYPEQARVYFEALKKADVPKIRLVSREDFDFKPGIDVTDVRQVKGLEFDYVILVDVNSATYPDDQLARNYLHVGLTRAAHQLWCIATGMVSPLLPKWLSE